MTFDFDPDAPSGDEGRDGRPRKLLSPAFWVMIALSLACILAGAAVGFAPRLLAPKLLRGGHTPRPPAAHVSPRLGSPPPAS